MRKKIVAGNWKMNLSLSDALELSSEVSHYLTKSKPTCEVILAPSFTFLSALKSIKEKSCFLLSAQDCSAAASGAFTGEVSAMQIKSSGADYVIIGHSERRKYHHEGNELLLEKIHRALAENLNVIFCCGETIEDRNSGHHFETVQEQLTRVIFKIHESSISKLTIAYEPVWAIGTGVTASDNQAQEMHAFIRLLIQEKFPDHADTMSILYGGSCNEKNAAALFSCPDIDGGLIGGASLKADSFIEIIQAAG